MARWSVCGNVQLRGWTSSTKEDKTPFNIFERELWESAGQCRTVLEVLVALKQRKHHKEYESEPLPKPGVSKFSGAKPKFFDSFGLPSVKLPMHASLESGSRTTVGSRLL